MEKAANCADCLKVSYFTGDNNFGDELNKVILEDFLGFKVIGSKMNDADLFCIGSILDTLLKRWYRFSFTKKSKLKIWGSGFIAEKGFKKYRFEKFARDVDVCAVRGELTLGRIKKMLNQNLTNVVLGDPGLLISRFIDTQNIRKEHEVGVICHFIDKNNEYLKNIKLDNPYMIDVQDDPYNVIKHMASCKVILSSAMHGLIAADSLNIPNQWIKFSDNVVGNDYKFRDYYSVFGIDNPKVIDLRENVITDDDIIKIKNDYIITKEQINEIQDKLLKSFPYKTTMT